MKTRSYHTYKSELQDNTSQTEEFRVYCENCDSRVKVTLDLWHQLINYNFKTNSPNWTNDVHNRYIYPGVSWTGRSTAYQGDGVGQVDNHGGEFVLRSFIFVLTHVWSLDFFQATMTSRTLSSPSTPTSTQRLLGEAHLCVGIGVYGLERTFGSFL